MRLLELQVVLYAFVQSIKKKRTMINKAPNEVVVSGQKN